MDGKRLIEKIRRRNILSFGDLGEGITLEPLNIIIGQNASGKSNLVDVIKLIQQGFDAFFRELETAGARKENQFQNNSGGRYEQYLRRFYPQRRKLARKFQFAVG